MGSAYCILAALVGSARAATVMKSPKFNVESLHEQCGMDEEFQYYQPNGIEKMQLKGQQDGSALVELDEVAFNATIISPRSTLVMFYAEWCPFAQNVGPVIDELASDFKTNSEVMIAKVDGTEFRALADRYHVRGFPEILFFPKGNNPHKIQFMRYTGDRSKYDLTHFLVNRIGLTVETVNMLKYHPIATPPPAPEDQRKFAAEDEDDEENAAFDGQIIAANPSNFRSLVLNASTNVVVEFFTPWCPHCQELSPVMKKMASSFKGSKEMTVVSVDCESHASLFSHFSNVKGFPTVLFIPKNGGLQDVEHPKYKGARNPEAIATWANEMMHKSQSGEQNLLQEDSVDLQSKYIAETWETGTELSKVCDLSDYSKWIR